MYSQPRINKIEINILKGFKNFEIDFTPHKLTAILGVNGSGKSSILHILACAYKPISENETTDYKLSQFFRPTPDSKWLDSNFKFYHSYRVGDKVVENAVRSIAKKVDRWSPPYSQRIPRYISYIGIESCVPLIEKDKKSGWLNFKRNIKNDTISNTIREKAAYILNKNYTETSTNITEKYEFIGVKNNEIAYSALNMGAGEQRIFKILEEIYNAPKYGLILIDEIDLLLHTDALRKLITVISDRAIDKELQIIFTTHRELITEFSDKINIRHIFHTPEKTLCFNDTNPDIIHRLTGKQEKYIEIFVEDNLSKSIIEEIAAQLRIRKHVSVRCFGAAINSFTVGAGLLLSGKDIENSIFILDGDFCLLEKEKEDRIKKILTGDTNIAIKQRAVLLKQIKQFNYNFDITNIISPEEYIFTKIKCMDSNINEEIEIIEIAKSIHAIDKNHNYLESIYEIIDYPKEIGFMKTTQLFSKSEVWESFTKEVKEWLQIKIKELNLIIN